jgi:hypothetical protein
MKKAKRRGRPRKVKPPKPIRVREHMLRPMIREACRTGMVEAIEHCSNFWSVADGYKKYIDDRIAAESEALMAAVRAVLREPAVFEQRPRRKRGKR